MISYKVLVILTVIFYIITYCNGGSQESDDDILQRIYESDDDILQRIHVHDESDDDILQRIHESDDDILQRIHESDEYKTCYEALTKFGLKRDSGYYNLVFTLQFKKDIKINDESFLGRLERKLDLPNMRVSVASEEEIDQKLTEQEFMDKYDINKVIEKNRHLHDPKIVSIEPLQDTVYTTLIEPFDAAYTITTEIEITSFMYTFYKDVFKVDYTEIELWMDPSTFCTAEIMKKSPVGEKEKKLIKKAFGVLRENRGFIKKLLRVFKVCKGTKTSTRQTNGVDENIENEEPDENIENEERNTDEELEKEYTKVIAFTEEGKNVEDILECAKSLDKFDVDIGGNRFKFNEHNVFWSSVVAMILSKTIIIDYLQL